MVNHVNSTQDVILHFGNGRIAATSQELIIFGLVKDGVLTIIKEIKLEDIYNAK